MMIGDITLCLLHSYAVAIFDIFESFDDDWGYYPGLTPGALL
jgi:hypothetical protein